MYVDVLIHSLTAVVLTTCRSNTVHIYTHNVRFCIDTYFTAVGLTTCAITQYKFTHKLYVDVVIHLLTAFGLTTYGSNTFDIYTQTVC